MSACSTTRQRCGCWWWRKSTHYSGLGAINPLPASRWSAFSRPIGTAGPGVELRSLRSFELPRQSYVSWLWQIETGRQCPEEWPRRNEASPFLPEARGSQAVDADASSVGPSSGCRQGGRNLGGRHWRGDGRVPGDSPVLSELEGKLEAARKAATDSRPLSDQLAGCRAAIDRREKKLGLANVAVSKAVEERDAIEKDLAEHRAQLFKLEQEADRYKSMNVDDIETGGPEKQEMLQLRNDFLAAQHQNSALAAQMLQAQEFTRSLQRSQDLLTTERDALRLELSASAPVV